MLESLELQNFKSFRTARIDPATITVLIGENGTGKSSLGQALILLKQSLGQATLVTRGGLLNLGDYADVVHKGSQGGQIGMKLVLGGLSPEPPFVDSSWSIDYNVSFREGSLTRHSARITGADRATLLTTEWIQETNSGSAETNFSFEDPSVPAAEQQVLAGSVSVGHGNRVGRPFSVGVTGRITKFPEDRAEAIRSSAQRISVELSAFLANVYLVSAIRGFERPEYPLAKPSRDLTSSESAPAQAGITISALVHFREFEDRVSHLLKAITGGTVRFRVIEAERVALEVPRGTTTINIVNEGFGTNQLIRTLLQVLLAPKRSMIIIEEPEIHLHPRAQVNLVGVLLAEALEEQKQLVLTTHSEHILIGLLNAVAERKLSTSDLKVYYSSFAKRRDSTNLSELEVGSDGSVVGGLPGFFEVELEQMDRYLKALGGSRK